MEAFFREESFHWVIDATHPTPPLSQRISVPPVLLPGPDICAFWRDGGLPEDCVCVDSTAEAVRWLSHREERVLLTVGSKELAAYKGLPGLLGAVLCQGIAGDGQHRTMQTGRSAYGPRDRHAGAIYKRAERGHPPRHGSPDPGDQADRHQGRLLGEGGGGQERRGPSCW